MTVVRYRSCSMLDGVWIGIPPKASAGILPARSCEVTDQQVRRKLPWLCGHVNRPPLRNKAERAILNDRQSVVIYNEFKNAASQILTHEQFLPLQINQKEDSRHLNNYIFEPSLEYMIRVLIPDALKIQFFKAILDSKAAEHGARMTAMHQATDNATEMISDLNLSYNKARQASITNEILEIVGGAEALKG